MALISIDGKLLNMNASLHNLLGCDQYELFSPSQPSLTIQAKVVEQIPFKDCIQTMDSNQQLFDQEYFLPSGYRLTLGISISLIRDSNSSPLYYFAQFENKTVMRQMEERLELAETILREKEDSFQQVLEGLPLSVIITKHGIIKYANPASLRLIHAASMDELVGLPTNQIVDTSNHTVLAERRTNYYSNKTIGSVCYLIHCLNGQQKYVDGFSLPISYKGESAVVGIFKDISEQKLEEERIMQSEKLSTAGQLAAGIAHEIRNPLTAIVGFLKLLRSSEQKNDHYFSIIESELKRIEFIVNELLVLSKPQAAHTSKPLDCLPLLEQVITLMNGQAVLRNIEIVPLFSEQSIWINGEANQLKQVFINLLKNAMEAMNNGGSIYIHVQASEYEARISVQDEGCGMTDEQIKELGRPFLTTKDTGTGLGFIITHNIVHNHGGAITIKSLPHQGTTFTVVLPLIVEPKHANM
nr:ATP-binding protein [Paenibacillus castaneae]